MKKILGTVLSLIIIGLLVWFFYQKDNTSNTNIVSNITNSGTSVVNKNQDNPILATPIEKFDKNNPEDREKLIYKIQYSGKEGLIKGDFFNVPSEKQSLDYKPTASESVWIAAKNPKGYAAKLHNTMDSIKSGKLKTYSTMEEYLLFYYLGKIKDEDFQVSKLDSLKLDVYMNVTNIIKFYFLTGDKSKTNEIIDHLTKMKFFVIEPQKGSMEDALYTIVKNKGDFKKEEIEKISVMPVYSEDNLSLVLRMIILNNEEDVVKIKKIYEKGFYTMNSLLDQLTVQSIVNKYENINIGREDKIRKNFLEWATENQLEHTLEYMFNSKLNNNIKLQIFANKLNRLLINTSEYKNDGDLDKLINEAELLVSESEKLPSNSYYPAKFPYFILSNLYTYKKEYNKSIGVMDRMKNNYNQIDAYGGIYGYNNVAFFYAHYGQNYLEVKNYDRALYYYNLEIARQPFSNYMTMYIKAIEELKTTGKTGYTLWNNN